MESYDSERNVVEKIIKCPVYIYVKVPHLCQKFMNTPIFQRLGRVKQLGLCYHVYPSAVHTRKEHSMGVMHLTGKTVDHLRNYVNVTDREKELLQLAALYHDVGHLAYSHMFDDFLKHADNSALKKHYTVQTVEFFNIAEHELRSVYLLKLVNEQLNELLSIDELEFTSNIILGEKPDSDKRFYMYEIVNNKLCGIDTDKMDYLYRDAYHTGFPNFQPFYIINSMMVNKENNHIVFKRKAETDIEDLFRTRQRMFIQVYKHHTVEKITRIYKCAMNHIGIKLYKYGMMTDDMNIETLLRNSDKTADMFKRIDCREFYHTCEYCKDYIPDFFIKKSGGTELVRYI